ncbi:MAG: hypothetical protein PSV35_04535 [bacterium]|nr:hypothetical protein [bacterium]
MKIILTCHVLGDGTGDLQHLIDFYTYLVKNEETKNHEFVVIITFQWEELEPLFQKKNECA